MPVTRNGAGDKKSPAPAKLLTFSAVPERRKIRLEVINPDNENGSDPTLDPTVERDYWAYPKGSRCPLWVEMEVQAAFENWRSATYSPDAITDENPTGFIFDIQAELTLRRELLRACIEGLDQREADVLGAEGGPWDDILDALGWHKKATAENAGDNDKAEDETEDDEDEEDPEPVGADSHTRR